MACCKGCADKAKTPDIWLHKSSGNRYRLLGNAADFVTARNTVLIEHETELRRWTVDNAQFLAEFERVARR